MTKTEQRALRRERCNAKYAVRFFAEEVRATESGHNGNSGVAYGIGGGLVNVPAKRAADASLWRPAKKTNQTALESTPRRDAFELMFAD